MHFLLLLLQTSVTSAAFERGHVAAMKVMKSRLELEHIVLAEIASSLRCPPDIQIAVQPNSDGRWEVAVTGSRTAHHPLDSRCTKRILAVAARLQIGFELGE
jgi:hypothetical protein